MQGKTLSPLSRQNLTFSPMSVALPKDVPPLRVPEDDPLAADIFDHGRADLAREGPLRSLVAVLCSNADALAELATDILEVDGGHCDDHLSLGIEGALRQELADDIDGGFVAVHLPVAANKELPVRRHLDFSEFGSFDTGKMQEK